MTADLRAGIEALCAEADARQRERVGVIGIWPVPMGISQRSLRDLLAARPAVDVEGIVGEIAAEVVRHATKGYTPEHDDVHGAVGLGRMARNYLDRALAHGNRSDLVKSAAMVVAAIKSVDRLCSFEGAHPERAALAGEGR